MEQNSLYQENKRTKDLLTPEQERELTQVVHCMLAAAQQAEPDPTILREGQIARNTLLENYIPLIALIARSVASTALRRNLPTIVDELIQEGVLLFIDSLATYDPDKGRISTYVVPRLRVSLHRKLHQKILRQIHIPQNVLLLRNKELQAYEQEQTTHAENHLLLSPEQTTLLSSLPEVAVSLDAPYGETDEPIGAMIEGTWMDNPEQVVLDHEAVSHLLSCLTRKQRHVIIHLYGLFDTPPLPTDVLARHVGISRQAVEALRTTGLRRLRQFVQKRMVPGEA